MSTIPPLLDHLVYATPSLERTVDEIEAAFGVRPLPGGVHPAWGTRNAILPLGPASYLELIGPDRAAPTGPPPAIFGLATLAEPRLATWAAKGSRLAALVEQARGAGIHLGHATPGSRRRADGSLLSWELTDPLQVAEEGLIPFFIDWGSSAHPAAAAGATIALTDFRVQHPDPDAIRAMARALGLDLRVERGPRRRLVATFRTPRGVATLQ